MSQQRIAVTVQFQHIVTGIGVGSREVYGDAVIDCFAVFRVEWNI